MHLHAGRQFGVGAAQRKYFCGYQVFKLILYLVVGNDFLPQELLQDLAHHEAVEGRMPFVLVQAAEEVVQVGQFERVFLALPHPCLQVFKLLRQLLIVRLLLLKEALLKKMVVVHQVPSNGLGHVHIFFEFLLLGLLRLLIFIMFIIVRYTFHFILFIWNCLLRLLLRLVCGVRVCLVGIDLMVG